MSNDLPHSLSAMMRLGDSGGGSRQQMSPSKFGYLIKKKILTNEQIIQAILQSRSLKKPVEQVLLERFRIEKTDILESLARYYGCEYRTFDANLEAPKEVLIKLKKAFLVQDGWVPLLRNNGELEVALEDPGDLSKTDRIRSLIKTRQVNFAVALKDDIHRYINQFFDAVELPDDGDKQGGGNFVIFPDVYFDEEEEAAAAESEVLDEAVGKAAKFIDQILVAAWSKNASDIHIEPSPISKSTTVRFRIDGVCHEYANIPLSMANAVLSRVKVMAGLNIAEKRLPQDGRIRLRRKGLPQIDMRLATYPITGGYEDAVLRILAKPEAMKLEDTGMNPADLTKLDAILKKPYGLFLAVGPTGSGKTTTLHAALSRINKPDVKILTAEDPVEILQPGLRQVEARPQIGFDFERIMRSFLRADPDVIMIGEMRDYETASTVVEASLTGHLVFSTLHTNSAPETVSRILDMKINPLSFSDAFLAVLAQRLARRVCRGCGISAPPQAGEIEQIFQQFGETRIPDAAMDADLRLIQPKGCENCSWTGYRGRVGLYELLVASEAIKSLIKSKAATADIFLQATTEGMKTLKQDGLRKIIQGITDKTEVVRVCSV